MLVIIEMMIIVTVERDKRSKAKSTYANQLFLKTRERRRERGGSTSSNLLGCLGLSRKVRSLRSIRKVPGGLECNRDQRKFLASSL